MVAVFSSETSGSLRTTQRHNPEDRRENLKSNTVYVILYTMQKTISLCSFMNRIKSISTEKDGVSCKGVESSLGRIPDLCFTFLYSGFFYGCCQQLGLEWRSMNDEFGIYTEGNCRGFSFKVLSPLLP
jgi:hypothetical protein